MFNEDTILNELSVALKEEIVNYNCRHLVKAVTFFRDADTQFVNFIVQRLKFEVFQQGDPIVVEGTYFYSSKK